MFKVIKGVLKAPVIGTLKSIQVIFHDITTGHIEPEGNEAIAADSVLSYIVIHLRERYCEVPDDLKWHFEIVVDYRGTNYGG